MGVHGCARLEFFLTRWCNQLAGNWLNSVSSLAAWVWLAVQGRAGCHREAGMFY